MKRSLLLPLLLLSAAAVSAQKNFEVSGKVEGLRDSSQAQIRSTADNSILASAWVIKDSFHLSGQIAEPGLFWLAMDDAAPQHIYLEGSRIKVTGKKSQIDNVQITGSRSHNEFNIFRNIFSPLMNELNNLAGTINGSADPQKRDALIKTYMQVQAKVNQEVGSFVSKNRSSYVSPFLLLVTSQINDDILVMNEQFKMLDSNIRASLIGKRLEAHITENLVGTIGSMAPDFSQTGIEGQPVALSSFRGKYVLIDFWASWCGPCRVENPNVVNAYKKFNKKNFTILGVSLDKAKEPWEKAIKADNLTWTHVSDLKFWQNEAAQLYRVQSIPQNFLVDPAGRIVAKNLRGEELESKLCELLGCK